MHVQPTASIVPHDSAASVVGVAGYFSHQTLIVSMLSGTSLSSRSFRNIHNWITSCYFRSPEPGQFGKTSIGAKQSNFTFRRDTPHVRHIYRRVPMWHAVRPVCLSSRFNAVRRMSGIFLVVFRHDMPSVRHIYYCVKTQHVAFVTASRLSCCCGRFAVAYSSSMTEPTSGGVQHKRRNRKSPPILGAAAYILGLPPRECLLYRGCRLPPYSSLRHQRQQI